MDKYLKHLISEIKSPIKILNKNTSEDIINILKNECSIFYDYYQNTETPVSLYRGSGFYENIRFAHGSSPINREPKDSNKNITDQVDNILGKLGAKAKRTNSIFCTTSKIIAQSYNESTKIIIPTDNKTYFTYFSETDLYLFFLSQVQKILNLNSSDEEINALKSDSIFLNLMNLYSILLSDTFELKKLRQSNSWYKSFQEIVRPFESIVEKTISMDNFEKSFNTLQKFPFGKKFLRNNKIDNVLTYITKLQEINYDNFMKKIGNGVVFGNSKTLIQYLNSIKINKYEVYIHGEYYIIDPPLLEEIFKIKRSLE